MFRPNHRIVPTRASEDRQLRARQSAALDGAGRALADTRIQLEVEDWVRRNCMPTHFGKRFSRERLPLRSGGVFDFDAVSDDHSIVATISTSGAKTRGGKHAVGKILKLRSDMLFLAMAEASRRVIVLTERDMFEQCGREAAGGRRLGGNLRAFGSVQKLLVN